MFGLFKSKQSPIRRRIRELAMVQRTWFEWTLEGERWEQTLVVEFYYGTDPSEPDFYQDDLDAIAAAIREIPAEEPRPARVRVIPRMYEK